VGSRRYGVDVPERPPVPLTYLVKQLEQAVRKELDRRIRPLGITTLQYTALSVLERQPGMTAAQLARRSFVSPQAAGEMVAALERKELIERVPDPRNPHILAVRLTRQGRAMLKRCGAIVADIDDRMAGGMKAADRRQLRALLTTSLDHLRDA